MGRGEVRYAFPRAARCRVLGWEKTSPGHVEPPGTSHTWLGFNFLRKLPFSVNVVPGIAECGGELLSCRLC